MAIRDLQSSDGGKAVTGEFCSLADQRYYVIHNVDRMAPFFVSVISSDDHWLFASSTGGLTAGRVSPATALFPYITVDKIHDSAPHTGSKTIVRVTAGNNVRDWEPFNREHDSRYAVSRHLYKSLLGDRLLFEEINHDLELTFRYCWSFSSEFGIVRRAELENTGTRSLHIDVLDGLQNILPAGTPPVAQANTSNLVDAYKWTELDESTGLGLFTLYSGISDRAEPAESLRANTVFGLGLDDAQLLLSTSQIDAFRRGLEVRQENHRRGIRGAYLAVQTFELAAETQRDWQFVADVECSQKRIVALADRLGDRADIVPALAHSIAAGSDALARTVARADGFQAARDEVTAGHHYANVLFNVLRGGIFADQNRVPGNDLAKTIRHFNKPTYERHRDFFDALPDRLPVGGLLERSAVQNDPQLARLCREYLPVSFARRHGDPSRPWNRFAIELRDANGDPKLSYQGNWRDIFQNWEALAFSYPEFIEGMIAKFVNASTADGYNPYRITKDGIDWEVEDPDDPWSYIGYWGDHQIIYLLKLLEWSQRCHPQRLADLLLDAEFAYANVPYRIRPFARLLDDPKQTVDYDAKLAARIEQDVESFGADARLLRDRDGDVVLVTLLEKLLVPLLAKLANLVIGGGIWMNTQRPEWNDANNALVGHGLSVVTLCYLRRYVVFLQDLLPDTNTVSLSSGVADWLRDTASALGAAKDGLEASALSAATRLQALEALGLAAERYRQDLYGSGSPGAPTQVGAAVIGQLLDDALHAIDFSVDDNRRDDGMYHAYNLLEMQDDGIGIRRLYPMLEGQVAALSSGRLDPEQACEVVDALFASDVYRPDQDSFMLYPDRPLRTFLERNVVPAADAASIPLLRRMLDAGDERIVSRDGRGDIRFNAAFANAGDLDAALSNVAAETGATIDDDVSAVRALYETVFDHRSFTGRSGTMFGFEGVGCIYWHMVAKLLLAIQENFFAAVDAGCAAATTTRLGELYYRVRAGLGFNKTPAEYGAFPMDPYSHTPRHSGARQPGMTGQVKEELLTRFGELGIRVHGGAADIVPALLRQTEFAAAATTFRYLDTENRWQQIELAPGSLAFTWCQVPFVYTLGTTALTRVTRRCGSVTQQENLHLDQGICRTLFERDGNVQRVEVTVPRSALMDAAEHTSQQGS